MDTMENNVKDGAAMTFGPRRGHPLFIFENFFKDFSLLIIALVIGLIQGDMDFVLENAGVLIVVLIGPVGRIAQYFTTYYAVDGEKLIIKSGLFNKKNLEVPLSTITTVDFSQSILHQIFGTYSLNVDNASNVSGANTKIKMTFAKDDALSVRDLLIQGRTGMDGFNFAAETAEDAIEGGGGEAACEKMSAEQGAEAVRKHVKIKVSDLAMLGLLKAKGAFFFELIAIITSAMAIFNVSSSILSELSVEWILSMGVGFAALLILICIFLLSVVCGIAGALIRYYGFEILDNGEAVKIQYGLLTKKRYIIQKNRISGFRYDQSFLMGLAKTGTLQLFAIGYGGGDSESGEEPILFPMIKEADLHRAMAEILPEMELVSDYRHAPKGSLHYFFYGFGFVFALTVFGAAVYLSLTQPYCGQLWILGLLCVIYSVWGRTLEYRHARAYCNAENISMTSGGFSRKTIFVKASHVESVSTKTSRWKAKKGVANLSIGYIAPLTSANKTVKNLPAECGAEIREKLIY